MSSSPSVTGSIRIRAKWAQPTYTVGNGTQATSGAVWYKAALAVVPPPTPPLVVVPPTPIVNVPASLSIWVQLPQDGGCGYADQYGRRYLPQEYGPESYFAVTSYLRDLLHGNEMTGDKAGPCNVARPYLSMVKNPEIMLEVIVAKSDPGAVETRRVSIGAAEYNQQLSKKRANTVRALLVSNGLDGAVMRPEGRGEDEPVVACEGTRQTPELVQCLQPNRRVTFGITAALGQ